MNIRKSIPALTAIAVMTAGAAAGAAGTDLFLQVAKQDYPYGGLYAAARGDDCLEDKPLTREDMNLIVAPQVENGVTHYYAIPLHVDLKRADMKAHRVQADGSLKGFATEKVEFMGTKVTYETSVLLKPLDGNHILATEWTITYRDGDGNITDIIDMTKADGGNYGGEAHENILKLQPGENGVCLKHVGDVPS